MAFKSQSEESKIASRRGSNAVVVVSQVYKPSTKSEEMSFRVSSAALKKISVAVGDRVDVLFDEEDNLWMIVKNENGFSVSGKKDGPTGLIRYTLKDGHVRLTNDRTDLPYKCESDDASIKYQNDSMIFKIGK